MNSFLEKSVQTNYDDSMEVSEALDITLGEAAMLLICANVSSISFKLHQLTTGDKDGEKKGSKGFKRH